tara:strand:+ start:1456 stop:3072 length:1617 start_codon:yes stop_codon:yes gene_type:complete
MIKTIIYSCVFFNETYINLINLLLKSYKLFGNSSGDVDYLIICNPDFQKKIQAIFDNLNISGKIWCIDVRTKFKARYSRLKIFNYPNINLYSKILYLDCDILVTNSINNILDFQLENKLYALQEGNTNHEDWGSQFFDKNPNCSAFTSGILLFNNNTIIKDLFSQILLHIHNHITSNSPIPICLDQPFIIYHAVKNNLYDNQKLINIVINNPNNFNNETISHFPGGQGNYESKIVKMTNYMNNVMFNLNKNNYFKIQIDDYKSILDNNKKHFDKLYTICKEIGEKVEGNCFTAHLNIDNTINELIYKQLNHFSLGMNATNIMEIGFNAGHSSLLYLLANPNSKLTIFDICQHKYTLPCFKYLQSVFPDRLQIFPGDSTKTVPEFYTNNSNSKFDLIHIDGAHFGDIPNKDFYNSLKLASDIIIWDDTQKKTLNDLLNGYIKKGLVSEIFMYKTLVYQHRICRLNKLLNKKYVWGNSIIEFLENGKMNAFGTGKYRFIDKYLIKCDFGGREHLLKFNDDYSRFISIRKDDFEVVVRDHL